MKSKRLNPFQVLRDQLAIMSFYERFEQVVALVLSAVIALSRKFVILDSDASPAKISALAGATLALGATYWLLRKRGDRAAETSEHDPSSSE